MPTNHQTIIDATKNWVERFIVKYNICPFARQELDSDTIRYVVLSQDRIDPLLDAIENECRYLDAHPEVATTLLMPLTGFDDFDHYLDLVDLVQHSVIDGQYEGVYQLATFHPDYCFEDSDEHDPANYTNRSPYPTLHLIREDSISEALRNYDEPESIPQRNIAFARRKGLEKMTQWLHDCYPEKQGES